MVCRSCLSRASRILIIAGVERCPNCGNISEAAGARTDSIITRNSTRIRQQQKAFEKDTILPHRYDKASKKVVPNEQFIHNYPTQAKRTFSQKELKQAHYGDLTSKQDKT